MVYECEGEVGADKHRGEQEGVHFCLTVFSHCENKDVHPQNPDCSIDHGVYIIMFCVV